MTSDGADAPEATEKRLPKAAEATPLVKKPDGATVAAARELLLSHVARLAAYHAQKENMGWAALTVYLGLMLGLLSQYDDVAVALFRGGLLVSPLIPGSLAFAWLSFLMLEFMIHQVEHRHASQWEMSSCIRILTDWLDAPPRDLAATRLSSVPRLGYARSDKQVMPKAVVTDLKQHDPGHRAIFAPGRLLLFSGWALGCLAGVAALWQPYWLPPDKYGPALSASQRGGWAMGAAVGAIGVAFWCYRRRHRHDNCTAEGAESNL